MAFKITKTINGETTVMFQREGDGVKSMSEALMILAEFTRIKEQAQNGEFYRAYSDDELVAAFGVAGSEAEAKSMAEAFKPEMEASVIKQSGRLN